MNQSKNNKNTFAYKLGYFLGCVLLVCLTVLLSTATIYLALKIITM